MNSSRYEPVRTTETATAADDSNLHESLVAGPPSQVTVAGIPQIQVEAPSDLPEGYQFRVTLGGSRTMMVTVPPGGVEQGQKWSVPLQDSDTAAAASHCANVFQQPSGVHIPVGHWRDSLFGVFNYGLCHPHWWTALTCSLCKAIGEIAVSLIGMNNS